jgi:hypothetical protein
VREQRTKREQQEQHEETVRRASKTARTVYGDAEVDELLKYTNEDDQLDEHEWHDQDAAELQHREEEAAAARWSELGRLGFAFTRSVQQPDPFSKLNRYETSIARRLTRTRHELATLQEAGDRPE